VTYFESQADRIDKERQTILDNHPDIGDLREDTVLDFLNRHTPKRCASIKGGFIFDHLGNRSKQIDIIITSDSTLQFRSTLSNTYGKSFNCIEGCSLQKLLIRLHLRTFKLNLNLITSN
jgi:hypothetical protein